LVDQAIRQDQFQVRTELPNQVPTDDERHSVSVIDIFRFFNETIEQIVQLNWDNDLQYAQFMTALSKTVGVGLARYCEVLEQRFSKEMDRLSPEQEAAANQTRQEKWMQLARDAWNNKEKIEPFQFYPEVLLHFFSSDLNLRYNANYPCSHSLNSTMLSMQSISLIGLSKVLMSMRWRKLYRRIHQQSFSGNGKLPHMYSPSRL
jgi:hypothetical protein